MKADMTRKETNMPAGLLVVGQRTRAAPHHQQQKKAGYQSFRATSASSLVLRTRRSLVVGGRYNFTYFKYS
jgi:hypothetical protein